MADSFKTIGNLAFYNNWSPNYFYFNTLRNADEVFSDHSYWNAQEASKIADKAIGHAESQKFLMGMSEEDAMSAMTTRFENICDFLDIAYNYELNNEMRYFKQKYNQLKSKFTSEEITSIEPLAELMEMFQTNNVAVYDYDRFITLINILLQGINNTKTIADYEAKRIKAIDDAVENILTARGNQASGLGKKKEKTSQEISDMVTRARDRMESKITYEYLNSGNLSGTHTTKTNKQAYNIWGYKKYFQKVKPTIDVAIAKWATNMLHKMMDDPNIIKKFTDALQADYPKDGNFHALEQRIQGIIIQSVQHVGLNDLSRILKQKMTKNAAKNLANEIIKDESIFDAVQGYNINGLNPNYGMYGLNLELFKDVDQISDLEEKYANQLFEAFDRLMKDKDSKWGITKEQSFLLEVFKKNKSLTALEEMTAFIHRLEKLQEKMDKLQTKLNKNLIKINEINGKTLSAGRGKKQISIQLKTVVQGDKVVIEVDDDGGSVGQIIGTAADFRRFGFKKFNPQNLKSAIRMLKSRASSKLKENLIAGLDAQLTSGNLGLTEKQMMNEIKQGFQNLKVSIGGPKASEIAAGIHFRQSGGDTIIDWVGGINGKNDVVTITVNVDQVASSIHFDFESGITDVIQTVSENKIQEARKEFLEEWNEELKDSIQQNTQDDSVDKYSSIAKKFLTNMEEHDNWSSKLQEKYQQLENMWKRYKIELERQGISDKQIEAKRKEFLDVLGQSFYISTTVKTYNDYQNRIGFLGGSLGTNLDDQMDRLADIFMQCGLPIKNDLSWLKFAIINCSPLSIHKQDNKNLIENYLGSVAALALFDEGGAEGQIIQQFTNNVNNAVEENNGSADILHLYKVNGMYVPGSFVLQQVIKTIRKDVLPQIQEIPTTIKRGAGITIINGANESMIPNRPITETDNPNRNAWTVTGQAVKDSVKLQILFLAGLMDIANGINKTLGNIELLG